jgi:hypothetical protein
MSYLSNKNDKMQIYTREDDKLSDCSRDVIYDSLCKELYNVKIDKSYNSREDFFFKKSIYDLILQLGALKVSKSRDLFVAAVVANNCDDFFNESWVVPPKGVNNIMSTESPMGLKITILSPIEKPDITATLTNSEMEDLSILIYANTDSSKILNNLQKHIGIINRVVSCKVSWAAFKTRVSGLLIKSHGLRTLLMLSACTNADSSSVLYLEFQSINENSEKAINSYNK